MLEIPEPAACADSSLRKELEFLSLWGEGEPPALDGGLRPRTYCWTERVPKGLTVIVGHDVRSNDRPTVLKNVCGGRVIFLDTGCGKGGHLSWLDLGYSPRERFGGRSNLI